MKTALLSILAILALTVTPLVAHEKTAGGPNGGRLITDVVPHAEFLVTPERKVQITFLGEDGKPVAPAGQIVTVTAGNRSAPTTLTFVQTDGVLLSAGTLPAGNNFPTVLQIKPSADAKTTVARFNLNVSICGECDRPEYACICGH